METYTPKIIEDRTVGEHLAVSIGTALALESLIDDKVCKGYTHLYMNVKTLYRNFHGSFMREKIPGVKTLVTMFANELMNIHGLVSAMGNGKLIPFFYVTTGNSLSRVFPNAKVKTVHTPKQKAYESLQDIVLPDAVAKLPKGWVSVFDMKIKGNNSSSLIITHLPIDLLSHSTFRKLVLLESHTAAQRSKTEWISKLTKREDLVNIPFNTLSIQILGDHNNQLTALGAKMTNILLDLATENKWHSMTTMVKIQFDIRKLSDKSMSSMLLEMTAANLV